jgi:pyridoxamine 5'-phosphate oxidase family protein
MLWTARGRTVECRAGADRARRERRARSHDGRCPRRCRGSVSVFTDAELRYLTGGRQLGRLATVGADGTPHVVPVGWIYNGPGCDRDRRHRAGAIEEVPGIAGTGRAAIVIDDLESTDPWRPRGVEVRGRAEAIALPTPLIRIHPERIISWGLGAGRSARTVTSQPAAGS